MAITNEELFREVLESQGMYKNNFSALYLTDGQIDGLIEYTHELREQVERIRELEHQVKTAEFNIDIVLKNNHKYRLENAKYGEALRKINRILESEPSEKNALNDINDVVATVLEETK